MNSSVSLLRLWMSCLFAASVVAWLPAASLAAPSGPEIDVIPDSLVYGSTQIGSGTAGSFAVINLGFDELVVSAIAVTSGSDFSVDFGLTPVYCESSTPVIPGFDQEPDTDERRCLVRVRFTPSAVGISTGEVTISSNDADEPNFVVSLQGTGVPAPVAEIDVDPVYIDFMTVAVGSSVTREITVSNAGPDSLVLGGPTLSNWVDFSLDAYGGSSPCGFSGVVAAGSSCSMTVTFAPTTTDPVAALLTIVSNDQDEPTVDVTLAGNGGGATEDCFNSIDDDGDGDVDCSDSDCFSEISCGVHACWEVEEVDLGDLCVDIAVDDDGDVHLVYFAASSGGSGWTLRHAVSNPDDAPDWVFEDVDTTTAAALGDCAVALGSDGGVHIAYVAENALQYATDTGGDWELWTVAEDVDANTSIALDSSGLPHMSFRSFQDVEVSPGVFEREFSPYYARQLASGGDFETYNPEFGQFVDGSGGLTPYTDRSWYAEVNRIALDSSDYPLVLFSDASSDASGLGRIPDWAEGTVPLGRYQLGQPVDLALGTGDELHAAGVVPERSDAKVNQLVYATHPGGAYPEADDWSYHVVEMVKSAQRDDPVDAVVGSLALDSEGDAHFAFRESTGPGKLIYLKVILDGDRVFSQVTELVNRVDNPRGVGRSAEIAVDASDGAHIGYFEDGGASGTAVRYARQIECPGPLPSISPSDSVFYQLLQVETFYVSNIGPGDLEISSIRIAPQSFAVGAHDWYLVDCAEDHPLDFLEGDASEPTAVDLSPPVVLAEGEFGAVCVGFDPAKIREGMLAQLIAESSEGPISAGLSAGGKKTDHDDDGCGCAMSSPGGDVDIRALLAFSMFAVGVLLWRAMRLRA